MRTETGVKSVLVNIDRDLLVIPSLAIHMTRGMADQKLNPQVDLLPLFGDEKADSRRLSPRPGRRAGGYSLERPVPLPAPEGTAAGRAGRIYPRAAARRLQCAFSAAVSFLAAENAEKLIICAVFDNEEVGSRTKQGADSTFLTDTVCRIRAALGIGEAEWLEKLPDSFMLSADNAHAVHPNYAAKCDETNRCYLNGGVVVKSARTRKYTTDAVSASVFGRSAAAPTCR